MEEYFEKTLVSEDMEILSTAEMQNYVRELKEEFLRLESDMKNIIENRSELKRHAKKKGVDLKAFEASLKKLKEPREDRDNNDAKVALYLSILEG